MKAKSWLIIGVILFIFMTWNNLDVISNIITMGPQMDMMLSELWDIRNFEHAQLIFWGLYAMWLIYAILHGLSVYMIIKGVKKRRIENGITIDKSKNKVEEKRDSSLEILKKRYASGEISEEEFNKMKENLE